MTEKNSHTPFKPLWRHKAPPNTAFRNVAMQ